MTCDSEKLVSVTMLAWSKDYFEALLRSHELFGNGLAAFVHEAPRSYYRCLLELKDYTALNEIRDVAHTSEAAWKQMLTDGGIHADAGVAGVSDELDLEGEPDAARGCVRAMHLALPLPAVVEEVKPQQFEFDCLGKRLLINLDGLSHQSGQRHVYASCPWKHWSCHKYHFLNSFPEQ